MTRRPTLKNPRNRTIRWEGEIDEIADSLVQRAGGKIKGGVSELLTRLVLAEAKRKRGIAHLHSLNSGAK